MTEKEKIYSFSVEILMAMGQKIKTRRAEALRAPAIAVTHPIMTCTKRQVGCRSRPLLLPTSTIRQSGGGRSANRKGN